MRNQKRANTRKSSLRKPRVLLLFITLLLTSTAFVSTSYAVAVHTHDDEMLRMREAVAERMLGEASRSARLSENDDEILRRREAVAELLRNDTNRSVTPSENNVQSERYPDRNIPQVRSESDDWMLVLVNAENPLPDNFSPRLQSLPNGLQFDERAIGQLNAMLAAMRSQGLSPVVASAYRSIERQRTLFDNRVTGLIALGFSRPQAEIEARKSIAYPGTSEHNLGLAVDIVSLSYQHLNDKQADTLEIKWLIENSAEYGFILRYPKGKEDITGVKYEPWHFRYVGVTAAQEITRNELTLEEFLSR